MKPSISSTIKDYQTYLDSLYGEVNKDKSWEVIYGYLSRTTGYLARNVLKKKVSNIDFFRSLSWLFALSTKLDMCLQTSFQMKFPDICPYCLERTCVCFRTEKNPLYYKPGHEVVTFKQDQYNMVSRLVNRNLGSAVTTISKIYPNNEIIWHFSGPWMNCSKLFEEIAELHESIVKFKAGKKSKESVMEEFADVFSWIISAWICLNKDKSLDDEFISYYVKGCPVCECSPCTCPKDGGRTQGIVNPDKFRELRLLFEELETLVPDPESQISELIKSIKAVEQNQTESVANVTILEAKKKFEILNSGLSKTEEVASKLSKIGKAIMSLSSLF